MRKSIIFVAMAGAAGIALFASKPARADVVVVAGAPEPRYEHETRVFGGVSPGTEAEVNVGSGFSDTYNVGFGGRLGFTTAAGVYLGGDVEHFIGSDVVGRPHNTFLGGEIGLKLFPTYRFEVRPYGFLGADIHGGGGGDFAFHPGVIFAYHFGNAFINADLRYFATPEPTTLALMGGAGLSF